MVTHGYLLHVLQRAMGFIALKLQASSPQKLADGALPNARDISGPSGRPEAVTVVTHTLARLCVTMPGFSPNHKNT